MDAARRGRTLFTGMKKLAVVLLVLIGGSIPYLIAQQPIEVPSLIPPAPVALPLCSGCGKTMVLIAQLARKPP